MPEQLSADALCVLRDAVAAGQVKQIGLGTSIGSTKAILAQHPGNFDVVQVNHFWGAYDPEFRAARKFVTHRVVREGQDLLKQAYFVNAVRQEPSFAQLLDVLRSPAEVPQLLLAASLQLKGPTHVLVASSKPARIRQFMEVANSDAWSGLGAQLNSALLAFRQTHNFTPLNQRGYGGA